MALVFRSQIACRSWEKILRLRQAREEVEALFEAGNVGHQLSRAPSYLFRRRRTRPLQYLQDRVAGAQGKGGTHLAGRDTLRASWNSWRRSSSLTLPK
jgi:hypothetical protein